MLVKNYWLSLSIILSLILAPATIQAEEVVAEEEIIEEAPIEEFMEETSDKPELADPDVYVVPMGQEMNFKVWVDHPMDHAGKDFIEYVRMESPSGEFLGLKTFTTRDTKAHAEFVINPKLATFEEVKFIVKSTTLGSKTVTSKLEFTADADLPDEINPRVIMEKRLEAAKQRAARAAGKDSYTEAAKKEKVVDKASAKKEVTKKKKKKSGWFGG